MLVYISHPYSSDTQEGLSNNVLASIDVAIDLQRMGIHSICPNLSHHIDVRAKERNIDISWSEYLDWDLELLESCDCLLLLGDSPGCKREEAYAKEIGMRIFTGIDDVVDYSRRHQGAAMLTAEAQALGLYEKD